MKKVFLIHGFEGKPNGGWRPWLMAELAKVDIYAGSLSMPSPDKPVLIEWLEEIHRHVTQGSEDEIYLVGHSLGGTAILRYLEKYESSNLRGAVSVSGPCSENENPKISNFLDKPFDWEIMAGRGVPMVAIHGDDDPMVPLADAELVAEKLDGELIIISNGQHLNGSAGFTKLPKCLDAVVTMLRAGNI